MVFVLFALLIGGAVAFYLWNKPHRDPTSEKAISSLSAMELQEAFAADALSAQEAYIDQVVEVNGIISEAGEAHLVLDNAVYVRFADGVTSIPEKGALIVKGRVVSYDDLFEQVRLDFATIEP